MGAGVKLINCIEIISRLGENLIIKYKILSNISTDLNNKIQFFTNFVTSKEYIFYRDKGGPDGSMS